MNKTSRPIIFLGLILIVSLVVQQLILGGGRQVKLNPAPALSGSIAQALYTGGGKTTLLMPNQDFSLKNTRYFDKDGWAVTAVSPNANQFNPAIAVLQKKGADYQVVLGPGSAFPSSVLLSLPADVANYLKNTGATYELSQ